MTHWVCITARSSGDDPSPWALATRTRLEKLVAQAGAERRQSRANGLMPQLMFAVA